MTDPLDLSGPNPWQTRSSTVVFDNVRMRLLEDEVIGPGGHHGRYAYLQVPWPVVGIVPLTDDGCVYLVRQWRYPWKCNSWEIPAGVGESDEEPLAAAQRELAEEIGLRAESWEAMGTGFSSASVDALYHLFLARGLSLDSTGAQRDDGEMDMIARAVPLQTAIEAAMDGRILHSFSVVGLLRAARRLGL
jgi:8-oxo-dGTP pyrophosphatase MutT (NUDIX family)